MSPERPEVLLKSALEKIVYFEARSEQLQNDLNASRAEVDRLKAELGAAAQREIELRRQNAEQEVKAHQARAEVDEGKRLNDALRRERAALIGKLIESAQIHASGEATEEGEGTLDLASFIAELRGEALLRETAATAPGQAARASGQAATASEPGGRPAPANVPAAAPAPESPAAREVTLQAQRLQSEGRLALTTDQLLAMPTSPGEESLFGFSLRELSAADAQCRVRAAERLKALGNTAAAPALASAIHAEREPEVLVALLGAFAGLSSAEGSAIVAPLLESKSPEVRLAALKTLMSLDPSRTGPYLSAAIKDPDRAVRRRASLLALGMSGADALALGEQAAQDTDSEVRRVAALVLAASGGEKAKALLLVALRDPDAKVRHAAAQSLSRLLGQDVSAVVSFDELKRRREVRRLAALPARTVTAPPARSATELAAASRVEQAAPATVLAQPMAAQLEEHVAQPQLAVAVAALSPQRSVAQGIPEPARKAVAAGNGTATPRGAGLAAAPVAGSSAPVVGSAPARPAAVALAPSAATPAPSTARPAAAVVSPSIPASASAGLPVAAADVDLAAPTLGEPLCDAVMGEIRCAIRGRTTSDLASFLGSSQEAVQDACELLVARGQVVRRGMKFFAA